MTRFDVDPVGPYYNGLGKSLGDAVIVYPVDIPTVPTSTIPTPVKHQLPIVPILILSGIIIFLLLNK